MIETVSPAQLVNTATYPLEEPGSEAYLSQVTQIREQLAEDGCAVLKGFLSPRGLQSILNEVEPCSAKAYYAPRTQCNVYLGEGDPELPPDHPRNRFLERTNGFVTADNFDAETAAHKLYYWPPLCRFLSDCLNKEELHIYADPVSNMIVNVVRSGEQFNWHYDTNEFTITYLLQGASAGGYFEYIPDLRNPHDECYEEVRKVLDGDRSRVKRLDLAAGDMQLFLGRFSLHRVTPNEGERDRLLLIQSFAEEPGMIGNAYRVGDLYGKTTEVHRQAQARQDQLLD